MPNSIISVYPYRGNKKCSTFAFLTDDTKSNDSIVKVYYTDKAESLYDNITVPENANYIWVAVNPREESIIQRYIVKYDSTSIYDISKKIEDTKAELEESINNIEDTIGTNDKALYCVPIDSNHIENGYIRTDGTKAGSSGHSMAFYDILEKKTTFTAYRFDICKRRKNGLVGVARLFAECYCECAFPLWYFCEYNL